MDDAIQWQAPVPMDEVIATMQGMDALLVPSTWLETGPLVVYEALAAGTRVIGSQLGGIAELSEVYHGIQLVSDHRPETWATKMREAMMTEGSGDEKNMAVNVRTHHEVGTEMHDLYRDLLSLETPA